MNFSFPHVVSLLPAYSALLSPSPWSACAQSVLPASENERVENSPPARKPELSRQCALPSPERSYRRAPHPGAPNRYRDTCRRGPPASCWPQHSLPRHCRKPGCHARRALRSTPALPPRQNRDNRRVQCCKRPHQSPRDPGVQDNRGSPPSGESPRGRLQLPASSLFLRERGFGLARSLDERLAPLRNVPCAESKLLKNLRSRRRSSKPFEANHVAVPAHILPPSQRRSGFYCQLRQVIREDRCLVRLGLLFENLPARHGDHARRNALFLELRGGVERHPHLRTRRHNQQIR